MLGVPGDMKLPELNRIAHTGLTDTRMTTVGGVILRHLERFPKNDDSTVVEGITLTVLEMQEHRISRVRVGVEQSPEEEGPSGADAPPEERGDSP